VVAALLLGVAGLLPNDCFAGTDDAAAPASADSVATAQASNAPAVAAAPSAAPVPSANLPADPPASSRDTSKTRPWPAGLCCRLQLGASVDVSSLGFGGQIAVRVLERANVRAGFDEFDYHGSLNNDGIFYSGDLNLKSANVNFDYFLFRSFHVSPGLLVYDRNNATDTASVPAGEKFILGTTTYESSAFSPVDANARLGLIKVAPEVLLGIGNMIPQGRRRWSVEVEAGVAFQGSPKISLNLSGFACVPPNDAGPSCTDTATDPTVQSNVRAQQIKLEGDATIFKFYPVVTIGFGYSF
jgi:hypothetical protein